MSEISEILHNLGYPVEDHGTFISTKALYRDGQDIRSVAIYKNSGKVVDFVTGNKFHIKELISLTLGHKSIEETEEWLENQKLTFNFAPEEDVLIKMPKVFPNSVLDELKQDHSYWLNRGISEKTIVKFKGGVALDSKLKNRYVLPIFNSKNQIVGLTGRALVDSKIKWKHLGSRQTYSWPLHLNLKTIQTEKTVILVESPGCVLSLFEAGIENCICLFGVELSLHLLNVLIRLNPNKIIISTNNEKSQIGNDAAKKIEKKLLKFFDRKQVKIKLPWEKDFNEMLIKTKNINEWYK